MVSSALLAAEDPLKADSERNNVSKTVFTTKSYNYTFFFKGFKEIRPFLHGCFHS